MALEDKFRWNKKYLSGHPIHDEPVDLVKYYYVLAHRGVALDIACGKGRHSKFLAQNDFMVDALDISEIALDSIANTDNINTRSVDLDEFEFSQDMYDLVVCTYYLNRQLFPAIIEAMRSEAILIYETFVDHPDNTKAPSKPEYLLQEDELKSAFGELEIIYYDEWWDTTKTNERALKASLVAKKVL
ncbi:MAG: methyltransferase domain-containing protein [Campylobacterales bacterium]|nr:methyltransferase domain-containing protein [Campylobacterales bacterium]